jgi:hypothetical protein
LSRRLTAYLTPHNTVLLRKLILQLIKKIPELYCTRMFITVFTMAHH